MQDLSKQDEDKRVKGSGKRKGNVKININFDEDRVKRLKGPAPRLGVITVYDTEPWRQQGQQVNRCDSQV